MQYLVHRKVAGALDPFLDRPLGSARLRFRSASLSAASVSARVLNSARVVPRAVTVTTAGVREASFSVRSRAGWLAALRAPLEAHISGVRLGVELRGAGEGGAQDAEAEGSSVAEPPQPSTLGRALLHRLGATGVLSRTRVTVHDVALAVGRAGDPRFLVVRRPSGVPGWAGH